jgi:hypothetical protein
MHRQDAPGGRCNNNKLTHRGSSADLSLNLNLQQLPQHMTASQSTRTPSNVHNNWCKQACKGKLAA